MVMSSYVMECISERRLGHRYQGAIRRIGVICTRAMVAEVLMGNVVGRHMLKGH